jgi:acyl-CoA synthetase (AMP-forming)/AMP-acid ligase II
VLVKASSSCPSSRANILIYRVSHTLDSTSCHTIYRLSVPDDVTIWEWLFEEGSKHSPLNRYGDEDLAGYVDAITKERVSWKDVKEAAGYISTALVREHDLKAGDTMSLFSRNTIWYPVMLFSAMRVGMQTPD